MDSKITIGMRLHQLIKETGLEQQEVAARLGIKTPTFNGYVSDNRKPNFDILMSIADYFGITIDYLIGYSDERNKPIDLSHLSEAQKNFISDASNLVYIDLAMNIKEKTAGDKKIQGLNPAK